MSLIKITCERPGCDITVERERGEVNRSRKHGRKLYCSRTCSGKVNVTPLKNYQGKFNDNLLKGSKGDEYSPFRDHLRRVKRRNHEYDITLEDLKEQWDIQEGRCTYTGIQLQHVGKSSSPNYQASLDRIDSSKGYDKGNIQFVSVTVNRSKCDMSEELLKEFLDIVRER